MKIDVDLTNVPVLRPIPTGTYVIRLVDFKAGESQTGNPKLTVEADIIEPRRIAEQIPKWYFTLSLAEKALFRVRELYEACGCLHAGSFDTDELLGKTVGIKVTYQFNEMMGRPGNQLLGFVAMNKVTPNVSEEALKAAEELDNLSPESA